MPLGLLRNNLSMVLAASIILTFLCPTTSAEDTKPTIAVLRFENKSTFDRLDDFEIGLPYMLIGDLSNISSIELVERDRMDKLIAETELSQSDIIDPITSRKVGKALGADIIIRGSFVEQIESGQSVEESSLVITLSIEDVNTGKIIKEIQMKGNSSEFYRLEKEIVRQIIEALKFKTTPEEIKSIDKIFTRSLEASIHFARGKKLQYKAANFYGEKKYSREEQEQFLLQAIKEFETALYLDPQYADTEYEIIASYRNLCLPNDKKCRQLQIEKMEVFVRKHSYDARVPSCLAEMAFLYNSSGDHDKAIKYYEKRILEYETNKEMIEQSIWNLIAEYMVYKEDYTNAIKWTRFLIEHYPERSKHEVIPAKISGYYMIFTINMQFEFYEEALSVLNEIIDKKLFPGPFYKAWRDKDFPLPNNEYIDDLMVLKKLKGEVYYKMGDCVTAIKIWEELAGGLEKLPADVKLIYGGGSQFFLLHFWNLLGDAYLKQDDYKRALYAFNKAISVSGAEDDRQLLSEAYLKTGDIYKKEGDWKKALESYERNYDLRYDKTGAMFNELQDNIRFCQEKLGIKNTKLVYWVPYYPFPKSPEKVMVDEQTTKCVHEYYSVTSLKEANNQLWAVFNYKRTIHCWSKKNKWTEIETEEDSWFVGRIDPQTFETNLSLEIPAEFGIEYIKDIYIDGDNIWLTCGDKGLLCYNSLLKEWEFYTDKNKLVHNTVWSIVSTPEEIWFGFGDAGRGGIMRYNKKTQRWQVYHNEENTAKAVTVLAVDGDLLWVASGDETVSTFDTKTGLWSIIQEGNPYGFMSGVHPMIRDIVNQNDIVRDIVVENSNVWFAWGDRGLKMYETRSQKWKLWDEEEIYDKKIQKWRRFKMDCFSIAIDGSEVWMGDFNMGVYRLNLNDGKLYAEDIDLGKISKIVVIGDVVWFAHSNGIMRYFKSGILEDKVIMK